MIWAKSFEEVKVLKFQGELFNEWLYAQTNYLGSDVCRRDTPQTILL